MKLLAVLALLGACGDDGGVRTLPDGALVDAGPGSITVTVRAGGAPVVAPVFVQAPDGTLRANVMTAADGTVTIDDVVAGSAVTVRVPDGLRTILAVQPGDDLQVFTGQAPTETQVPVTVRASTQQGRHRYLVATTCGGGQVDAAMTSGTLYVQGCATADVLVDVQDDNYESLEFAYAADQVVTGPLDLSALVYAPPVVHSIAIANADKAWNGVQLDRSLWTEKGLLHECHDSPGKYGCPAVPSATVIDQISANDDTVRHHVFVPATSSTTIIDLAGLAIATVPDAPAFDPATSTVRWSGGAGASFATVELTEGDGRWTYVGPMPADGILALPAVPPEITPEPFSGEAGVHLTLGKVAGGYAAVRARVFAAEPRALVRLTGDRVATASYEGGF